MHAQSLSCSSVDNKMIERKEFLLLLVLILDRKEVSCWKDRERERDEQ